MSVGMKKKEDYDELKRPVLEHKFYFKYDQRFTEMYTKPFQK